ncbi:MAG: DNA replication/repair protein RecF [Candidatus Aquicultorales bacterium]
MRINELRLISFRNFSDTTVGLGPGFNLVIGRNARGKTNLLEAAYILAMGKSPRTGSLREVVRFGEEWAKIHGKAEAEGRACDLEATIHANGRSGFKVNGVRYDRRRAPLSMPIAIFSPDHLRLIKGPPEERREFLDSILTQTSPAYSHNRLTYGKVLRERNVALQKVAVGAMDESIIDVYDEQLVASGTPLIEERAVLVERLSDVARGCYEELAAGALTVEYQSQIAPEGEVAGSFSSKLAERRTAELARGITLVGPHRDDLGVVLSGSEMRSFASQGEQRTACLALKLAELEVLEEAFHVKPLLLLDDVMSELDEGRRRALMLKVLAGGQALISSTNVDYFSEEELRSATVTDLV